jgi:hypothetical protein
MLASASDIPYKAILIFTHRVDESTAHPMLYGTFERVFLHGFPKFSLTLFTTPVGLLAV